MLKSLQYHGGFECFEHLGELDCNPIRHFFVERPRAVFCEPALIGERVNQFVTDFLARDLVEVAHIHRVGRKHLDHDFTG